VGDKELETPILYLVDSNGEYHKCHKLLPDIRRIFGEIEYLDGEPVEIIPNKERKMNTNMPVVEFIPPVIDSYYDRAINEDGTYENDVDRANQKAVKRFIETRWSCEVKQYPQTSLIDYYISAPGGRHCFGDSKTRLSRLLDHGILNIRKYCILMYVADIYDCPAFAFFYDKKGVWYIDVRDIKDETKYRTEIVGAAYRKSPADIEPAIQIPKDDMKKLI